MQHLKNVEMEAGIALKKEKIVENIARTTEINSFLTESTYNTAQIIDTENSTPITELEKGYGSLFVELDIDNRGILIPEEDCSNIIKIPDEITQDKVIFYNAVNGYCVEYKDRGKLTRLLVNHTPFDCPRRIKEITSSHICDLIFYKNSDLEFK